MAETISFDRTTRSTGSAATAAKPSPSTHRPFHGRTNLALQESALQSGAKNPVAVSGGVGVESGRPRIRGW